MADIDIAGIVVSLDGGETFRVHPRTGTGDFTVTGLTDTEQPYVAHAVGPAFEGSTLPAQVPPAFTRKPVITSQSTMVGATLGGDNGAWKGNPMPTLSRVFWLLNGTAETNIIPNQNGGTLSTASGFDADDVIYRGVEIQSVINGETVKVTEYSLPFTLTAVQGVLVQEITDPIRAGQPVTIKFNTALSAAPTGNVVFTGSGDTWTSTAPADPATDLIFTAKATGFTDLTKSYDVQLALPDLAVTSGQTYRIDNADETTDPISLEVVEPVEDADTYLIDPALLVDGPQPYIAPTYTKDGDDLVIDPGGWASLVDPDVKYSYAHLRDGAVISTQARYTRQSADAGKTVTGRITGLDGRGDTVIDLLGIAIPSASDTVNANIANINGQNLGSGETWTLVTTTGQIEALNGVLITRSNAAYIRGAADRGPDQYIEADVTRNQTGYGGVFLAVRIQNGGANRVGLALRLGSDLQLAHFTAAGVITPIGTPYTITDAQWPLGTTKKLGLGITAAGQAAIYLDGAAVRTATFTALSGGGAGLISNSSIGTGGHAVDNITIRSAK